MFFNIINIILINLINIIIINIKFNIMIFRCICNELCKLSCWEMSVLNSFFGMNNDFPDQSLNQTVLEPRSASCRIDSRTPLDKVTGACNFLLIFV